MDSGKVRHAVVVATLRPISQIQGIRNFIIAITVKVASDEVTLRKEKTYINKLNLALVQVCTYTNGSEEFAGPIAILDIKTRVASQLAKFHSGAC
jgi:hypothetical protein